MYREVDRIVDEVSSWAEPKFKHQHDESIAAHLLAEAAALYCATGGTPGNAVAIVAYETTKKRRYASEIMEKTADVFILICTLVGFKRFDLVAVTETKMKKNRARLWGKPNAFGFSEHVEDERPTVGRLLVAQCSKGIHDWERIETPHTARLRCRQCGTEWPVESGLPVERSQEEESRRRTVNDMLGLDPAELCVDGNHEWAASQRGRIGYCLRCGLARTGGEEAQRLVDKADAEPYDSRDGVRNDPDAMPYPRVGIDAQQRSFPKVPGAVAVDAASASMGFMPTVPTPEPEQPVPGRPIGSLFSEELTPHEEQAQSIMLCKHERNGYSQESGVAYYVCQDCGHRRMVTRGTSDPNVRP